MTKIFNVKNITETLIWVSVLLSSSLYSQNNKSQIKPGLYSTFQTLLEIENESFLKKKTNLSKNYSNLLDMKDVNSVKLDTDFINHILFHSPSKYASLMAKDDCAFYDLVEAGHIKDSEGEIKTFIVEYETRKGKIKTAIVSRALFMQKVGYKLCPKTKNFATYFNTKNAKATLKGVFLKTPKTMNECKEIHKEFINDYKTPYLCKIYEKVDKRKALERMIKSTPRSNYKKLTKLRSELRDAQTYKKALNANSFDYLKNLCLNIEKPKMFCKDFFDASYWKKISQGLKLSPPIENFCREILKKKKLSKRDIKKCARTLVNDVDKCHYLNKFSHALTPKPSCKQISTALNFTRLKKNFNDCPYKVSDTTITNTSRVINHFSASPLDLSSDCKTNSTRPFLDLNENVNDGKFWQNQLCYKDRLNDKQVCEKTIWGDSQNSDFSLSKVITKIMKRTKGLSRSQACKAVNIDRFKPSLLEFKSGCWIIIDQKNCYSNNCRFKIINDEVEVNHIAVKNGMNFPYFADRFTAQSITQEKFVRDVYKLKTQKIINISFLKNIFKKNSKAIIHGVGCREDLLPTFFQKRMINECTPLPFIIDGYFEEDGILSLVTRTAYDDLYAPRVIPWSYIFSSVKAYQSLSPINLWGLYALY